MDASFTALYGPQPREIEPNQLKLSQLKYIKIQHAMSSIFQQVTLNIAIVSDL